LGGGENRKKGSWLEDFPETQRRKGSAYPRRKRQRVGTSSTRRMEG